jgi:hypothetical protein
LADPAKHSQAKAPPVCSPLTRTCDRAKYGADD